MNTWTDGCCSCRSTGLENVDDWEGIGKKGGGVLALTASSMTEISHWSNLVSVK